MKKIFANTRTLPSSSRLYHFCPVSTLNIKLLHNLLLPYCNGNVNG